MRLTLTRTIVVGILVILGLGSGAMLITYNGLIRIKAVMQRAADIEEPIILAANEMEINVNGIALAVLKYLDSEEQRYLDLIRQDQTDFETFHARYLRLAQTAIDRELAERLGALYREFKAVGDALVKRRDKQEALFAGVVDTFEKIDEVIDKHLQPGIDPGARDTAKRVEYVLDLEADIAELGLALANYHRLRREEHRARIFAKETEFREALGRFKNLSLTRAERHSVGVVEDIFNQKMSAVREILVIETYLRENIERFVTLQADMDRLLDNEIQSRALEALYAPRKGADEATSRVIGRFRLLVPLFLVAAIGVAALLIRAIRRPIQELIRGTETVRGGDLSHRIARKRRDELGDLAEHFNSMVTQLEATTVSKRLLEASEQKLRETVTHLRQEIADRRRAEAERARLEASLRHAEQMSAMGSLLVGVAHEVRNPLFGVSSVLDAMDARFGAREEFQRYIPVLRGEVDRLTTLMQELLEYGKPISPERSAGSLGEVVAEAVQSCGPLAKQFGVEIETRVARDLPPVVMDRSRLVRAFKNLLENAVQHSKRGGTTTVEAEEVHEDERAWVACTVTDSGPGIPPDDLLRIFDPFFTRRRGGIGLGLSIVQSIVEGHGGTVTAGSRLEGGAVMRVRVPVASERPVSS
jgi:signal transduction histidine kinase